MDPRQDDQDGPVAIALGANATNNARHQDLRLGRWAGVRDALWDVLDPFLPSGAAVAIVGGGSCDDVPLARITERAHRVDLIDFDTSSTDRALERLAPGSAARTAVIEHDVTGGSADMVLQAVRDDAPLPEALPLPYGPLGSGEYDLVIGDMLYTQLLHAGLISLRVFGERQHELMRRYDPAFTNALVQRVEASVAEGGHAVHIHDLACWATRHQQPITLEQALEDPASSWTRLLRHDACDPHLALTRLGAEVVDTAWWPWPFEPNKQFLVRATVTRRSSGTPR